MTFEIKRRFTGRVLFTADVASLRLAVEAAVKARANLIDANLTDANLTGANLTGADLTDAKGLKEADDTQESDASAKTENAQDG